MVIYITDKLEKLFKTTKPEGVMTRYTTPDKPKVSFEDSGLFMEFRETDEYEEVHVKLYNTSEPEKYVTYNWHIKDGTFNLIDGEPLVQATEMMDSICCLSQN